MPVVTRAARSSLIRWIVRGGEMPGSHPAVVHPVTDRSQGRQTHHYQCTVFPLLRIRLGNINDLEGVRTGDRIVSTPFEDVSMGIRGMHIFAEKQDGETPHLWTMYLTLADEPIRPLVMFADAREEFGFQLLTWAGDQSGRIRAPADLILDPAQQIALPFFESDPVIPIRTDDFYGRHRSIGMSRLSRSRYKSILKLPGVDLAGADYMVDARGFHFWEMPAVSQLSPGRLTGLALRAAEAAGSRQLMIVAEVEREQGTAENVLAVREVRTGDRPTPGYDEVSLTNWLHNHGLRPAFLQLQRVSTSVNQRGRFRSEINPGPGLRAYVPVSSSFLQIGKEFFLPIKPTEQGRGVDLYEIAGDGFRLLQTVTGSEYGSDFGTVHRGGRRMHNKSDRRKFRRFLDGEASIDQVPAETMPVRSYYVFTVTVNDKPICLPRRSQGYPKQATLKRTADGRIEIRVEDELIRTVAAEAKFDSTKQVAITRATTTKISFYNKVISIPKEYAGRSLLIRPYQEGAERGIEIWLSEDGERAGERPIKTVRYR